MEAYGDSKTLLRLDPAQKTGTYFLRCPPLHRISISLLQCNRTYQRRYGLHAARMHPYAYRIASRNYYVNFQSERGIQKKQAK